MSGSLCAGGLRAQTKEPDCWRTARRAIAFITGDHEPRVTAKFVTVRQ